MHLLPGQIGAARGIIDLQLTIGKHRLGRARVSAVLPRAAQRNTQAGQQLVHAEGLCQIIVCTGIQSVDLVPVFTAGADDDDGHARPAAHLFDDGNAVHIRQAQIQQHHIRLKGNSLQQRLAAFFRRVVLVILRLQCSGDQVAHGLVVLHHQYFCFVHSFISSACRVKKNTEPWGSLARMPISPPCASTMDLHSASPRPNPRRPSPRSLPAV